MEKFNSLSHSRYDCKYHIVFVPKFRKKSLFGKIRQYLKGVFHELARQKGSEIVSGHMASDHVHKCVSIPPKYAVSTVGFELEKVKKYIVQQEKLEKDQEDGKF